MMDISTPWHPVHLLWLAASHFKSASMGFGVVRQFWLVTR